MTVTEYIQDMFHIPSKLNSCWQQRSSAMVAGIFLHTSKSS